MDPTLPDASDTFGVAGAQLRGGEVEDHVVRADRDDRPLDLGEAPEQLDLDLLP
jgi:hypothetical protein